MLPMNKMLISKIGHCAIITPTPQKQAKVTSKNNDGCCQQRLLQRLYQRSINDK